MCLKAFLFSKMSFLCHRVIHHPELLLLIWLILLQYIKVAKTHCFSKSFLIIQFFFYLRYLFCQMCNFNFVAKIGVESGKHKFVGRSQLSPCRHFLLTPGAKYETINFRQPDISKYCQHTPSTYISNSPITFYHYFLFV